ncbi:MAG: hypothetical protein CL469_03490 [Acidimicrobiaceae bacterium]|nr:hypothetical protein [Acidimicrobiaceae bacterium]
MKKGKKYETISFLSDFGTTDEFVGVVHSVINSIAPFAKVIDITHGIPHYDIRSGGLALARSAQYLSPGVVLAVVDPGVGTERRAVAVEVGGGESVLVGPDNGLLAPTVALVGGADRAVSLTETNYQLPAPGPTFAGRDIFGPAAAHIASGVDLSELGDEVEVASLMPGLMPITSKENDGLHAEVLWVDQYGNAQINLDPAELEIKENEINHFEIKTAGLTRIAKKVETFEELGGGELGLTIDSYGLLALVIGRGSAAEEMKINTGNQVIISFAENFSTQSVPVVLKQSDEKIQGDV